MFVFRAKWPVGLTLAGQARRQKFSDHRLMRCNATVYLPAVTVRGLKQAALDWRHQYAKSSPNSPISGWTLTQRVMTSIRHYVFGI